MYTPSDISFRRALDEDASDIATIEALSFKTPWTYEMVLSEIKEPYSYFYLAVLDKKVIGYYGFLHILDELHILNVAVHPDFRGMGVGMALLNDLSKRALQLSARAITLEVRESNTAAKRLYERAGFTFSGVRPHYYMDKENALIYWKEL